MRPVIVGSIAMTYTTAQIDTAYSKLTTLHITVSNDHHAFAQDKRRLNTPRVTFHLSCGPLLLPFLLPQLRSLLQLLLEK